MKRSCESRLESFSSVDFARTAQRHRISPQSNPPARSGEHAPMAQFLHRGFFFEGSYLRQGVPCRARAYAGSRHAPKPIARSRVPPIREHSAAQARKSPNAHTRMNAGWEGSSIRSTGRCQVFSLQTRGPYSAIFANSGQLTRRRQSTCKARGEPFPATVFGFFLSPTRISRPTGC